MATELLPVVDLRALSQSDLDALAAASAHALAPHSCPDAGPLPPLRIDRAVFNESAGSRKQTFSRLRLGAASSSPSAGAASAQRPAAALEDPDRSLVAYHLRRLFVPDDPSLPPPPEPQTLDLAEPPDPDRETTNAKGISVDLVKLAWLEDPYDAELQRRTAGMASEAELQGFIASVGGQWMSQRQRRKLVDASFFGDHLPRGWMLQLGLKRKGGTSWVHCYGYRSPKGNQFSTCKEVSSYLMTLLGYPEPKIVTNQYERKGEHFLCAKDGDDNVLGFQDQIGSSYSRDEMERNVDKGNAYECQKCNLTFCDKSAYLQHHFSYHGRNAKRRRTRTGKFGEPVVGEDGNFECPICHKTFAEESRYFGHVGAHARYHGLTPEAFLDKSSGRVLNNSLAEVSFTFQELTEPSGQINEVSYGDASFQHHCQSNQHGDNNFTDARNVRGYTNSMGHAAVPNIASGSNNQSDSSFNGFAGVTVFNDQARSNHFFRPTTFGTASHYQDQIINHGMVAPNHTEINNTLRARDVNLNSSIDTISFPIANADNETSTSLDKANRSLFTAKSSGGSFNNNSGASNASCSGSTNESSLGIANQTSIAASRCFSTNYGSYDDDNGAARANIFTNKNNAVLSQSNLATGPVYPVATTNADVFASRPVQSKGSDKGPTSNTKENNMTSRTSTGAGTEDYNSDIFRGGISDRGFSQFSNSFTHIKPNASSHLVPGSNSLTATNLIKGNGSDVNRMKSSLDNRSDAKCTKGSFINGHISNRESNMPMHAAIGKVNNNVQSSYNDCAPGCDPHAVSSTGQNVNGLVPMQPNFGSISSLVQSGAEVPVSSTVQDQCDLQLGFGAQKQQFSSHGERRSSTAGPPQVRSSAKNDSLPTGSTQFESRHKSLPHGTSEFGGFARPNLVPPASSHFGSMARPSSVHSAESPQFASMAQPNSVAPAKSSQFGNKLQPNSVAPAKSSQFGSTAGPTSLLPGQSSQVGSMAAPYSVPPVQSSQFGSLGRPTSVAPAESSQFRSIARPNSVHPAVSSQFGNIPSQNFVTRSEPTLVLGYAPQMGSAPLAPVQLGWDSSLPRMATGAMVTCVCIWCNSQFHHFGPIDGQQAGSFGFVCPSCRDRMSGRQNMPNNGSWQS